MKTLSGGANSHLTLRGQMLTILKRTKGLMPTPPIGTGGLAVNGAIRRHPAP
jgi:hypothetical protein